MAAKLILPSYISNSISPATSGMLGCLWVGPVEERWVEGGGRKVWQAPREQWGSSLH